jgi:hypothetical protein
MVKKCPTGKVLNPKTNRCIVKKCPSGKTLNPKTNRCIVKTSKTSKKKCPIGKILNPKTNRCIVKKSTTGKSKTSKTNKTGKKSNNGKTRWSRWPKGLKNLMRGCQANISKLNQKLPPYDPSNCNWEIVTASNGDKYESVGTNKTFTNSLGTSYLHKWVKLN